MARPFPPSSCRFNSQEIAALQALVELKEATGSRGIELATPDVRSSEELTVALDTMSPEIDGFLVLPGGFFATHLAEFGKTATEHKLPLASGPGVYGNPALMTDGAGIA